MVHMGVGLAQSLWIQSNTNKARTNKYQGRSMQQLRWVRWVMEEILLFQFSVFFSHSQRLTQQCTLLTHSRNNSCMIKHHSPELCRRMCRSVGFGLHYMYSVDTKPVSKLEPDVCTYTPSINIIQTVALVLKVKLILRIAVKSRCTKMSKKYYTPHKQTCTVAMVTYGHQTIYSIHTLVSPV